MKGEEGKRVCGGGEGGGGSWTFGADLQWVFRVFCAMMITLKRGIVGEWCIWCEMGRQVMVVLGVGVLWCWILRGKR